MRTVSDPDKMVPELEKLLAGQYRRTVYAHPDRQSDWSLPYLFLLAVWPRGANSWLFATYETTIRNVLEPECIGLGKDLASYLLGPFNAANLSEGQAIYLANYVISRVTGHVPI